jgi:flagellar hook-associated protein 1 FlgK
VSFSALSIAVSGLRAQSYAIETTSHNVANAATPGYRRQRVDLRAAMPRQGALGTTGAGVLATSVSRATDVLADLRARGAAGQAALLTTRAELATNAEDVFGEPDRGIGAALTGVWSSFAALAVAPSDEAARQQVLSSLDAFATRVNEVRGGMDDLGADALVRLRSEIDAVNQATVRVAEINRFAPMPGGLPADLADERDRLLDQLAASVGASSKVQADGQVRVTLSGLALVDGTQATPLTVNTVPNVAVSHPAGPVVTGGIAGGLVTALTADLPNLRTQLDTFVSGLLADLNALHATGQTPAGAPGAALLADSGGLVSVVPTTTADLAAADATGGPQNGKIADALAQRRVTQGDVFRSVANAVANTVAGIGRAADTARSISEANDAARDSVVGVNIDEEMTQLVGQQRAYQAAAKVITTVDQMLQSLLAM